MDEGLQDLTLASICDGALEQQFQERLFEALEAVRDHRRIETHDGKASVTIPLEVVLQFDALDGTFSTAARALQIKKPKPMPIVRPAYRRAGSLKVRPEIQPDLPNVGNVSDINAGRAGERE